MRVKTIKKDPGLLGYDNIENVRQGKHFEIELNENDQKRAEKTIEEFCKKLLANTIIENYTINYN